MLDGPVGAGATHHLPVRLLTLAAFITWLKDARVPVFIVGMGCAEPPPTNVAMKSCCGVARFIHWGNGLARPLEVLGFCLTRLLQHVPSSCGQYTPVKPLGGPAEICRHFRVEA